MRQLVIKKTLIIAGRTVQMWEKFLQCLRSTEPVARLTQSLPTPSNPPQHQSPEMESYPFLYATNVSARLLSVQIKMSPHSMGPLLDANTDSRVTSSLPDMSVCTPLSTVRVRPPPQFVNLPPNAIKGSWGASSLLCWFNYKQYCVDKKNQLDVTFCILYFSSNSCSTCFGQPCAHHQELTTSWYYSLVLVCVVAAGRLSRPVGR